MMGLGFWAGLFPGAALALFALYLVAAEVAPGILPDFEPARWAPRVVAVVFLASVAILFMYYFPIWTGISIDRDGYYKRMWLRGPGLRNWI
jgi:dolichyl-phosphate-mannose--protein O-mannosyl transferase